MRMYAGQPDHAWDRRAKVFYEGVPVQNVVVADTDEGWIEMFSCDDRGKPILNEYGNRVMTERLHGHITIEIKENAGNAD